MEEGTVDDTCGDGLKGDGTDIKTVEASSDGTEIEVVVTLCGPIENKTKLRVHFDYEDARFDDPDRNHDETVDEDDFCFTTSDDGMMLARNGGGNDKTTGASTTATPIDIDVTDSDMPVLTYTVKYSDLDGANDDVVLGTDDMVAIWVDAHDKGVADRAPDTDDTDGCAKPEAAEEVIDLELE